MPHHFTKNEENFLIQTLQTDKNLSSTKIKEKPNPDMYDFKSGGPKSLSWIFHDDKA